MAWRVLPFGLIAVCARPDTDVLRRQAATDTVSTCDSPQTEEDHGTCGKTYLAGGGIGSPVVAAFVIRDASINGDSIVIFENLSRLGGSLGDGYSVTGRTMHGATPP